MSWNQTKKKRCSKYIRVEVTIEVEETHDASMDSEASMLQFFSDSLQIHYTRAFIDTSPTLQTQLTNTSKLYTDMLSGPSDGTQIHKKLQ